MMNRELSAAAIRRASTVLILMLLALALVTGYWQLVQGPTLSARQDNPRLVLAERRVPRGAILDRNGQPLAVSQSTPDGYVRYYPERAAAPVAGYYSLRHGLGGAEASFDSELRGIAGRTRLDTFFDGLLHRVPKGRSVRLTLDLTVQRAADAALGDHVGAVVVLSVPEGQVIALASRPNYDPATLDQDWEQLRSDRTSPLVNRATQGAYQPGAAFQTVILAEALSEERAYLTSTVEADTSVQLGSAALSCAATPPTNTLSAAYAAGCPAPFAALADQLDVDRLAASILRWQLDAGLDGFELPTHTTGWSPGGLTTPQAVRELVLGQGSLTVSPLQMAMVIGTLANGGRPLAAPRLTFGPQSTSLPPSLMPPEVASALVAALPTNADLAGQAALANSGEGWLAWFLGLAPASSPRWVIVVLIEDGDAATSQSVAASVRAKLSP
jgi:peptidoglycan glycosyltransferase